VQRVKQTKDPTGCLPPKDPTGCQPHILPNEPAGEWFVNFLEADGHNCLLVWTERLSKLVVLVSMSNKAEAKKALEVGKAFVVNVFCWFSVPKVILSDRGQQFWAHCGIKFGLS
jgi:hypothetical protein